MIDIRSARSDTEPVVLLPAMGCTAKFWGDIPESLEAPVIHETVRGYSLEESVDLLLESLPARFALAGAAIGGVIAMALVRRAPERVSRLCLIATNPFPPTPVQIERWTEQRAALSHGAHGRDLQRALLEFLLYRGSESLSTRVLRMADDLGDAVFDRQLATQLTRVDERPALAAIKVPTAVLAPQHDRMNPVEKHQLMRDLIHGSCLEVIKDAGHLAPLESPAAVRQAMRVWLSQPT